MKMKNILWFLILGVVILMLPTPTLAAKKRVWGKQTVTTPSKGGGVSVSAKLTGWKQYLNISFRGVSNTKGISYELIYSSNGVDQGAGGGVAANEGNVTKKVFLGSCSHLVCTAHKNVSNLRLSVNYVTTSGQTVTKNYRVRY